MSMYTVLSVEIPTFAIVEWIPIASGASGRTVQRQLQARVRALQEESRLIQTGWNAYLAEVTAKSTQRMRGMLSQFLSTPLTSDTKEIQHILGEHVQLVAEQILPQVRFGPGQSLLGRVVHDHSGTPAVKRMSEAAKRTLTGAAGRKGTPLPEHMEMMLLFQGAANLDVLEALESRLAHHSASAPGAEKEGFHVRKKLFELRFLHGEAGISASRNEMVISTGCAHGEKDHLRTALQALVDTGEFLHLSLWQERFDMNAFELRVRSADKSNLRDALHLLLDQKLHPEVASCLKRNGQFYFKEFVAEEHEPD